MPFESAFTCFQAHSHLWNCIHFGKTTILIVIQGYYNTWTEEVPDFSETDDDLTNTDVATTEDSLSEISPGMGPNIEFEASTGGLDFMSSSGYPQIEYVLFFDPALLRSDRFRI